MQSFASLVWHLYNRRHEKDEIHATGSLRCAVPVQIDICMHNGKCKSTMKGLMKRDELQAVSGLLSITNELDTNFDDEEDLACTFNMIHVSEVDLERCERLPTMLIRHKAVSAVLAQSGVKIMMARAKQHIAR